MGILRTLLAIAVIVYHTYSVFGLQFCGGQIAVETFFIISGFYMAMVLNEKYIGKGSYKKFILSRFYRIFPAYWLMLLLTLLVSIGMMLYFDNKLFLARYYTNYNQFSATTLFYFIFQNIVIIGQDAMYFLKINEFYVPEFTKYILNCKHTAYQYLLLPQAWSISIELIFYAIAPFIVTKKIKWQLIVFSLSLGLKIYFATFCYLYFDPWTYRFFPFELAYFLMGSLSYQLYLYVKQKNVPQQVGYFLLVLSALGILFIRDIALNQNLKLVLFYGFIFISIPFIFKTFKNNTADKYIGELSFPLYISHLLLVSVFHNYFFSHFSEIKYYGLLVIISSLIVSILLNKLILNKIELFRHKKFI